MAIWGGVQNQTTTQTSAPPSYMMPYINRGLTDSLNLYDQGPAKYYPGQTVVPFSSETEAALSGITNRATMGSPVSGAATSYATNILNTAPTSQFGGASNPHLDATFGRAADAVQNRLSTQFAGAGRDIGASRAVNASELNDLATSIYGGAYESERNRMATDLAQQRGLQANVLGMAPQTAELGYSDLDRLLGVGGLREDLSGRQMQDAAARWDFEQNAPGVALDQFLNRSRGFPGSSSTSTTPMYRNYGADALGGALAGYQLGSQFGQGGWGAGIGGLLGILG